jgi:hypothetical protein
MSIYTDLALPERRAEDPLRALRAAHALRIVLDLGEGDAVRHARRAGSTWSEIGESLAITKQAAQQRFGLLVDLAAGAEVVEVHRDGCRCGMTAGCTAHLEVEVCLYCGDPHRDGPCRIVEPPATL